METQHTPTPWTLQRNNDLDIVGPPEGDGDYRFIASANCLIDQGQCTTEQREIDKANAAFIVKAVNAHQAYQAALLSIKRELLGIDKVDLSRAEKRILEHVNEAIAKAEGK